MQKMRFEVVSASRHSNRSKFTKVAKLTLEKYVMHGAIDELFKKKPHFVLLDLTLSFIKPGTIFGGCSISPNDNLHDTSPVE